MLQALRVQDGELSVVLVNDRQIRTLNRRYRSVDSRTDVLAFPMDGRWRPRCGPWLLGDVVRHPLVQDIIAAYGRAEQGTRVAGR